MASAHFEEIQNELEKLEKEYDSLLDEFRRTGEFDIFVGLDEDLYKLKYRSYSLTDTEEQAEIQNGINEIRNKINALYYSV